MAATTSKPWFHDDVAISLIALAGAWFFVVVAFMGFWKAHRLRTLDLMREDAPPGRYALELTRRDGEWTAGTLSFRVPQGEVPPNTGDVFTLVGDFTPSAASFRQSAIHPWPAHAKLHAGRVEDVVQRRIERGAWLAYFALTCTGMISASLIF